MSPSMPLALSVRVRFDPEALLKDPWVHEFAHTLLRHILRAEAQLGLFGPPPLIG